MKNAWNSINMALSRHLTSAVRWIFMINVIVFILFILTKNLSNSLHFLFFLQMQTPYLALKQYCVWQFVTYMFMHGGLGHLFFNMIALWFFAPRLEYRWGTPKFLKFYFIVGIGAGLFHPFIALVADSTSGIMRDMIESSPSIIDVFEDYMMGERVLTMLGASGALYGVLLAYALYWPNDTILLNFFIPIKAKYFMIISGVLVFFASISDAQGGVSHVTHLGGLLVAFIYLKGPDWYRRQRSRLRKPKARVRQVDPNRHPDFR